MANLAVTISKVNDFGRGSSSHNIALALTTWYISVI
jgi:hypothetical protein